MLMPGRHGYAAQGGWASGSSSGNSLPSDISFNSRQDNQPSEYVASNSIEFIEDFTSGDNNEFVAYIDEGGLAEAVMQIVKEVASTAICLMEKKATMKCLAWVPNMTMGLGYISLSWPISSVNPLSCTYPWYTPYQFAGNKPIK